MQRIKILLLPLLFCLVFSACVSQQTSQKPVSETTPIQLEALPRYVLGNEQIAPDAKIVLATLASRMRGEEIPVRYVAFDPNGDNRVSVVDYLLEGFHLNIIDITGYQAEKVSEEKAKAVIEGYFQFIDVIGRTVSFYFIASYYHTPKGLTIHSSAALTMPSLSPVLETYFVPVSAFEVIDMGEFKSFQDLYLYALKNAVPMAPTQQEMEDYEAQQNMSFMQKIGTKGKETAKDDYYIMTFCMSHVSPQSSLEMVVSKKSGASGNSIAEPVYLSWGDWRVMIAGGNFAPHGDRNLFYTNVFYTINPAGGDKPMLIGVFANQKNFTKPLPKALQVKVIKREASEPAQAELGPLESGYVFLDPSKGPDAKEIQKQLKNLGYYEMKVDGSFGKGSRKALQAFKQDQGLGDDSNWDLKTQKVLFKNSGL